MSSYLAILGRQPALSLAELISLYPGQTSSFNADVAIINTVAKGSRLGGTIKLAEIIATYQPAPLKDIIINLAKLLPLHLPDHKAALGLSLYGTKVDPKTVFATTLELKKKLRLSGKNIRIVPGTPMDSAQISHNQLIARGADVVIATSNEECKIGLTRWVQDIDNYALRDHGRPQRSPKVGMLPPKLAQIMINLANPSLNSTILDPFCGTGVVLQEAMLMGFSVFGSDIDPALIEMSQQNLDWLTTNFQPAGQAYNLVPGDATSTTWQIPIGAVVTEGYLGPPLTASPNEALLHSLINDSSELTLKFLSNLHPQLISGTPICLTLPAWRTKNSFQTLNIVDQITGLGYTLKQFLPVQSYDLLYARSDQIVGRHLITLIRK